MKIKSDIDERKLKDISSFCGNSRRKEMRQMSKSTIITNITASSLKEYNEELKKLKENTQKHNPTKKIEVIGCSNPKKSDFNNCNSKSYLVKVYIKSIM